jgi:amino acid transporter
MRIHKMTPKQIMKIHKRRTPIRATTNDTLIWLFAVVGAVGITMLLALLLAWIL